jgi:hypothetical protein
MKHYYSPHTGEHIATANPADWMGVTDTAPPAHDPGQATPMFQAGAWVLVPVAQPDPMAATAPRLAQVRAVREQMLDRLSGIAGRAHRKGDVATHAACDGAAVALLDITKDLPLDLPAMEALVVARYQAIVTTALTAAPGLASAFAGVDL